MRIPFTKREFIMLDGFRDTARLFGLLCLGGCIIVFVRDKNIVDSFTFLFMGLIAIGLSYWVPTVSLFEFWELQKEKDLKDLEEMIK